jgi:ribosomal protein L4
MLAIRNLKSFGFLDARDINPYDLLKAKHILVTHSAIPVLKEVVNVK